MSDRSEQSTLGEWLAGSNQGVALVFADIVGSTLLVHSEGTRMFATILGAYRSRADQLARDLDGRVVSREGDEVFAAFLTAGGAYCFARAMFSDAGHPMITVRVGIHFGTVSCDGSTLVGRAVPFAARVMFHAAPHEIWVSDTAKKAIEADSRSIADTIKWVANEECVLRGIPSPQVLWRAA